MVWLMVVITATLVTCVLPESFCSTARIKVERDQPDITPLANANLPAGYDPYFIQTEFELIQSEVVLGRVVDDLNLNNIWGKKYANGQRLKASETIAMLKARMDLRPVRNTSLIEIRVYSEKADDAAKIANAVGEAYKAFRLEQLTRLRRGGIKALEEQFAEQEDKVKKAQEKVDAWRVKLNISDAKAAGEGPSPLLSSDSLRKLEAMRIQSKGEYVRHTALLTSLKSLQQGLSPDAFAEALSTAAPDGVLATLQERLHGAEQQLAGLRKESGSNQAAVFKSEAVVEDLGGKIRSRVRGVMLGLSTKVLSLSNVLDNLEQEVTKATKADVERANQTRPYFDAKRNLEVLQRFSQVLEAKIAYEKADVDLPKTAMVEIVDRAVPALRPARPDKPLNITVAVIIGGVGGFVLATLVYALQWRAFRRAAGLPTRPDLARFRAIAYLLVSLLLAAFVGYLLANPLAYNSFLLIPLLLFVGGIAAAFIALANLKTESGPRQADPNDARFKG